MTQKLLGFIVAGLMMLLTACAVPPPVPGTRLAVGADLSIGIDIPSEKWLVAAEAPAFLVEEMAEHVAHDLEAQGREADRATIERAVAKRMAANEHFVYNPVSGAHMEIDFSPLAPGAAPPSRGSVADSARYAADSLGSEEGVSALAYEIDRMRVHGADYAYGLQASFLKHDVPTRFYGLIGFADASWFFIYYTDAGADGDDYPQAMQMIRSVQVVRGERR